MNKDVAGSEVSVLVALKREGKIKIEGIVPDMAPSLGRTASLRTHLYGCFEGTVTKMSTRTTSGYIKISHTCISVDDGPHQLPRLRATIGSIQGQ